jgi:hypothetical protein
MRIHRSYEAQVAYTKVQDPTSANAVAIEVAFYKSTTWQHSRESKIVELSMPRCSRRRGRAVISGTLRRVGNWLRGIVVPNAIRYYLVH